MLYINETRQISNNSFILSFPLLIKAVKHLQPMLFKDPIKSIVRGNKHRPNCNICRKFKMLAIIILGLSAPAYKSTLNFAN
jgi:hypothetical protein